MSKYRFEKGDPQILLGRRTGEEQEKTFPQRRSKKRSLSVRQEFYP